MRDYNAMIKANGEGVTLPGGSKKRLYPSNVLIEDNLFYNTARRKTANPVTYVDVVGGSGWVIRHNFFADFAKDETTDLPSYGAFLKGTSRNGIIERNLVLCEWRHKGGARVGLSLGGGGTDPTLCQIEGCPYEHLSGIVRNNIIANCSDDVGIYLNKAQDSRIYNNTLYNTFGILSQFVPTSSHIANNIVTGNITDRRGAFHAANDNMILGNPLAPLIPGLGRRLELELENLANRYSSLVPHLESLVGHWREFTDHTWLGNGTVALDAVFRNPREADFTSADISKLRDQGVVLSDISNDFCGNPRRTPPHDLGAVEYDGSPCNANELMERAIALERLPKPLSVP